MLLTDFSFSDQLRGVFEHRGGNNTLASGFFLPRSELQYIVATDTFVHFSKYVVVIFLYNEFEEGCRKTSFIKGPPQKRESR